MIELNYSLKWIGKINCIESETFNHYDNTEWMLQFQPTFQVVLFLSSEPSVKCSISVG